MSPAQIKLLQNLIAADRDYWLKQAAGELAHRDDRGIEVGWSCDSRTADSLVKAGLAEMLDIGKGSNAWIFLGNYNVHKPFRVE